jgi:hypothetical protein
MPSRSHQTDSRLRPKRALGLAKGMPLSVRIAPAAEVLEGPLEHAEGELGAVDEASQASR